MIGQNSLSKLIFFAIFVIGALLTYVVFKSYHNLSSLWIGIAGLITALLVSASIKIADQWERVVVLRLGKFYSLKGAGGYKGSNLYS